MEQRKAHTIVVILSVLMMRLMGMPFTGIAILTYMDRSLFGVHTDMVLSLSIVTSM